MPISLLVTNGSHNCRGWGYELVVILPESAGGSLAKPNKRVGGKQRLQFIPHNWLQELTVDEQRWRYVHAMEKNMCERFGEGKGNEYQ